MSEKDLLGTSDVEDEKEEHRIGTEDETVKKLDQDSEDLSSLNGEAPVQLGSRTSAKRDSKTQKKVANSPTKTATQRPKIIFNVFGTSIPTSVHHLTSYIRYAIRCSKICW